MTQRQVSRGQQPKNFSDLTLIRHLLNDHLAKFQPRALDAQWMYAKEGLLNTGFNPFQATIYYPAKSHVADWLQSPLDTLRRPHGVDFLIKEIWGLVHDYLHIWALHAVLDILPNCGYGTAPITAKNCEDFVFIHNVTEIAASVGTDYWFVSTIDLNREFILGARVRAEGYQTPYHENDFDEYHRLNPRLRVQEKSFFMYLAGMYLHSEAPGFTRRHRTLSPKLEAWLDQELYYSFQGRKLTRLWFTHLSNNQIRYSAKKLTAPIEVNKPWKRDLLEIMADLLWEKVKLGHLHRFSKRFDVARSWRADRTRPVDFRWTNLNRVQLKMRDLEQFPSKDDRHFDVFFRQLLTNCSYEDFDPELTKLFKPILKSQDAQLLLAVLRDQPRLSPSRHEPYDLFMPN